MTFSGKTVIVTGSSRGIGRDIALLFAERGSNVVIHGQNADKLKETEALLKKAGVTDARIAVVRGSLEEPATVDALIKTTIGMFGQLDVLVNNAGVSHAAGLDPNSPENLDYVLSVNVKSVYQLITKAIPYLEKTKGNVVNISSVGGTKMASMVSPYCISKAALDHLTHGFALQLASKGIRVNTVSPGGTESEFMTRHGTPQEVVEKMFKYYADKTVPMHRFAAAREISEVVAFVASPAASYMTGTNLPVDGGALVGYPHEFWQGFMDQAK